MALIFYPLSGRLSADGQAGIRGVRGGAGEADVDLSVPGVPSRTGQTRGASHMPGVLGFRVGHEVDGGPLTSPEAAGGAGPGEPVV